MSLPRLSLLATVLFASLSLVACAPGADPPAGDDGQVDPGDQDQDADGFTPNTGDCDDTDDDVYPGAPELDDDVDNDCDSAIDDDLPFVDDDGDGFTNTDGDCNDSEMLINPGAVEVNVTLDADGNLVPEGVDNDCDGLIDEGTEPCDHALTGEDPRDYAKAMELCNWVEVSEFNEGVPRDQHNIRPRFGNVYLPHAGVSVSVLSSGRAVDRMGPNWVNPEGGSDMNGIHVPHPDPQGDPADGCGLADPATVNDYISLKFEIVVPTNALALSYDFNFMSGEYPIYVCTSFDDTFLAMLDSQEFDGNISFDDQGRPVTINIGFFDVCNGGANCTGGADLAGTGFEENGGTGWLHTIAPVTPGERITLTFHLFDEGDSVFDSLVVLDNFQWLGVPVDGPITVPREIADEIHEGLLQGKHIDEIKAELQ